MIDNITLVLPSSVEPNYKKICHVKKGFLDTGLPFAKGELKNLKVRYANSQLAVIGSIPKYYLGSNLDTLTREDIALAIENLEDDLKLPIRSARVMQLEIGTNLKMEKSVVEYFKCLGSGKYYKNKLNYSSSIIFSNKRRSIQFYDKNLEMKAKKAISYDLSSTNILRIELKYKKKIAEQLGLKLKAWQLSDEKNYILMKKKLKEQYQLINKLSAIETPSINTAKELVDYLAYLGINSCFADPSDTFQLIEGLETNKQNKARMKEKIKKLLTEIKGQKDTTLVDELDSKFYQSIACI